MSPSAMSNSPRSERSRDDGSAPLTGCRPSVSMRAAARIARGPSRAPARLVVPISSGTPATQKPALRSWARAPRKECGAAKVMGVVMDVSHDFAWRSMCGFAQAREPSVYLVGVKKRIRRTTSAARLLLWNDASCSGPKYPLRMTSPLGHIGADGGVCGARSASSASVAAIASAVVINNTAVGPAKSKLSPTISGAVAVAMLDGKAIKPWRRP